jgi:hypothetical protein
MEAVVRRPVEVLVSAAFVAPGAIVLGEMC